MVFGSRCPRCGENMGCVGGRHRCSMTRTRIDNLLRVLQKAGEIGEISVSEKYKDDSLEDITEIIRKSKLT